MSIFGPWDGVGGATPGTDTTGATGQGIPTTGTGGSPFIDPGAWDVFSIGGVTSPGLAKIDKVARKHDFDRKKGKGTQGETITFVQKPAAEFKVTISLWTDQHFADWQAFMPLLKYDPTKKTIQAIEIYHPALAALEIHSVVCASLGGVHHEGKGLFTVEIDFLEYFPAQKTNATGTPNGSKQNEGPPHGYVVGDNGKDGKDTTESENAKLLKQAQEEGAL
jgi:hypothetical protein